MTACVTLSSYSMRTKIYTGFRILNKFQHMPKKCKATEWSCNDWGEASFYMFLPGISDKVVCKMSIFTSMWIHLRFIIHLLFTRGMRAASDYVFSRPCSLSSSLALSLSLSLSSRRHLSLRGYAPALTYRSKARRVLTPETYTDLLPVATRARETMKRREGHSARD